MCVYCLERSLRRLSHLALPSLKVLDGKSSGDCLALVTMLPLVHHIENMCTSHLGVWPGEEISEVNVD